MPDHRHWVWCQIGAREHYAMPRALHDAGRLSALVTDVWVPTGRVARLLPGRLGARLAERGDPGLVGARVGAFTGALLFFEARKRLAAPGEGSWDRTIARNDLFQSCALSWIRANGIFDGSPEDRPVVFAYSYAAKRILEAAKAAGCTTVLGQIDAGPLEEEIVAEVTRRHLEFHPRWARAPDAYWRTWREECHLADRIVVNSPWCRQALVCAGISVAKICVIPLAYEPPGVAISNVEREYPERFTEARPLRVLFLGSLILRKGIAEMLEALRCLRGEPVELWCVGAKGVVPTAEDRDNMRLRWIGPVARSVVHRYYLAADVFAFPTLSDGFGLTQLEAQAWGLPIIASRRCGAVVEHGVNGLMLEEVTIEAIVAAIRTCLADPAALAGMSATARLRAMDFRSRTILPQLLACPYNRGTGS